MEWTPQKGIFLFLASNLFLTACHKNNDPTVNTAAPTVVSSGTVTTPPKPVSGTFVIFSDELKSGGGAFLYPGGENQSLGFADRSNPVSADSIRYHWTGQDVAGQHIFAGMDLMHTGQLSDYASAPGKDLRAGKFSRVTFDARGALAPNTVLKVEVADDGNPATPSPCVVLSTTGQEDDSGPGNPSSCSNLGQLPGDWQRFAIAVTPANLAFVKDFFKATFIYKLSGGSGPGSGGTVFFDEIQYEP